MASYTDSRWDAGIGITDALTLVKLFISAMRFGDCQHNGYDARCTKIADRLDQAGNYRPMYTGLRLSDTITNIKSAISNLLSGTDISRLECLGNAVTRLEEQMRTRNLALPEPESVAGEEGSVEAVDWKWDDHTQDYYYWSQNGYFVYHRGGKVNADGTPYGVAAKGNNKGMTVGAVAEDAYDDEEVEDDAMTYQWQVVIVATPSSDDGGAKMACCGRGISRCNLNLVQFTRHNP